MEISNLVEYIGKFERYPGIVGALRSGSDADVSISASARAFLLAAIHSDLRSSMLVITASAERALRLTSDMRAFSVEAEVFPDPETILYDVLSPGAASAGKRLAVLDSMASGVPRVWVSSIQTAMGVLPPVAESLHHPVSVSVGDTIDIHGLAEKLAAMGYMRTMRVEGQGQFSVRGGIIDVFPSQASTPVRIELFGDEVESMRAFSTTTQRSTGNLKSISIYGCRHISLNFDNIELALGRLSEKYRAEHEDEIAALRDARHFDGIEKYLPFLYEETASLLDYLPEQCMIVVDEPEETRQSGERYYEQQQSYIEHLVEHHAAIGSAGTYFKDPATLLDRAAPSLRLLSIDEAADKVTRIEASAIQPLSGSLDSLEKKLKDYVSAGMAVVVVLHDEGQRARLAEILSGWEIAYSRNSLVLPGVCLALGNLSGGFESADLKLAIVSFADIFGRQSAATKLHSVTPGRSISSVAELNPGDFVVHSTHGIAVYAGLKRREVAGIVRDYALLEYAGTDKLFVPIEQLDRITRFIGTAGEEPTISRLGSAEWLKAKRKVKASVKKVAFDLLSLYAERSKARGHAYSADTAWQNEMEDDFVHVETPDQLTAIDDVKRDMESPKPMDRLICGDVGYGKTEVAVRSAFKAVVDGKQVLVLVPTTILAQQHYTTFKERLSAYPVNVDMVSRFRSRKEQKDTIKRFSEGEVDILIGTHRLLQSDIEPLDLGLVIIDEEQRFGVNDKEKIRNFKKSVDVLTLSATPIPRTMQMSLAGVRDMSVIETPPEERRPIITHVGRYDEEMLLQAIRRELGRGGQVYYVHNRVETITSVATRLTMLLPEARVAVAHGQMSENQLEKIMLAFLKGQYDVLVSTTIIESGIDIPNVNTLVVDRAEHLGLAQLYQLRGRVGRSERRAYAYFFFTPNRLLTGQAFERLKTISEFTELGSGVKIAMRDLEIRGAGSLLGAEQSGHMSAVGFELYCQMLREAIEELEGKPVVEPAELKIDLPVDAYLPEPYIAEENLRIEIYKRIILARSPEALDDVAMELADRFGALPAPVDALLGIARLRLLASALGINEVSRQYGKIKVSPIRLPKHQEVVLSVSYKNLLFKAEREYFQVTQVDEIEIIPFMLTLFSDIMSALSSRDNVSTKAR